MTEEIYLNTAGAGKMSTATLQTIKKQLDLEVKIGGYNAMNSKKKELELFYSNTANLINAETPAKIAYTDSASRSWNIALDSAPLKDEATIITLASEFSSNLISIYNYAARKNAKVELIPCNLDGTFSLNDLSKKIPAKNCLIALSHATAQGSIINPVTQIGKIAKEKNALFLVDGCQAVGNIPVDVQKIACDAYTATGRKWLCGPRGSGFLYIDHTKFSTSHLDLNAASLCFNEKDEIQGVELSTDARHFELWERNIASMLGLSVAIGQQLAVTQQTINRQISQTANRIRKTIAANSNLILLGKEESSSGISGFITSSKESEPRIQQLFSAHGINPGIMSSNDCPAFLPPELRNQLIFRISPAYNLPEDSLEKITNLLRIL